MNTLRNTMVALAITLVATACDHAQEACEVLPASFRALSMNALTFNGVRVNGRVINGMNLGNGIHIAYNGVTLGAVSLDGATLAAIGPDGDALGVMDFLGARLPAITADGDVVELEVAEIRPTTDRPDLTTYVLTYEGRNVCPHEEDGFFLQGVWDETATRQDAVDGDEGFSYTFACASGALAKCVAWGYAPWIVGSDAHQSCTRMVRADYCGDGDSYTKDGTLIDVGDAVGVQTFVGDSELEFEAGWGPDGAVCVDKPRYYESVVGGGTILPPCWEALPACESLDEATTFGATIANRSAEAERVLCSPR
jgi:hypothetical protein